MPRMLTCAEAVRLLDGTDGRLVAALDEASRGLLLGAEPTPPAVLGWLGARDEFAGHCRDLIDGAAPGRSGRSRLDRTRHLAAAHTLVVVLAYFEALRGVPLTLLPENAGPPSAARGFVAAVLAAGELIPESYGSSEDFGVRLASHYRMLSSAMLDFLAGPAARDQPASEGLTARLDAVASAAVDRYRRLLRSLAADFPEVDRWIGAGVRAVPLVPSLGRLGQLLTAIASDRVPEDVCAGLARAYQARLHRPLVPSDELPAGMRVPTLATAYVPPLYRVTEMSPELPVGDEARWEALAPRDDLDDLLSGFLTSPRCTQAPLMILGQPGAGKSVLCRVLAARLPAADFVAVLVSLREVAAVADLLDQIEQAVRAATAMRIGWPELAGAAAGALPVVMLDGFDELLQATGVSQSDFLTRVAQFQQRELDQGRAVAVLVTTRTSVADRARIPPETLLLRLEPFDRARIAAWLAPWNEANEDYFRQHRLQPLTPAALAPHPDLASQPLLLLMLALYDADSNALQDITTDELSHGDLYERLLRVFAAREVTRHHLDLTDADLESAVDEELRRLSIVAFAMLNRARQWVTDAELEHDLTALLGQPDATPAQLRNRLSQGTLMLGRFFFVHRAQAMRDDAVVATYEFLHATFGEYLVARLVWQVLGDTAARSAVGTLPFNRADHSLLYALLSFATLTTRTPTIRFLAGMAAKVSSVRRADYGTLLLRLFGRAGYPQPGHGFDDYEPRCLTVACRQAAYGVNLVTLAVLVSGDVLISQLYPKHVEPVGAWHDDCLLWHSQLSDEDWDSVVTAFAVERIGSPRWPVSAHGPRLREHPGGDRDIRLTLDDGTFEVPPGDPFWSWDLAVPSTYAAFSSGTLLSYVRRRNHIQCGPNDDEIMQTLTPLAASALAPAIRTHVGWQGPPYRSAAQALLEVWLLPTGAATAQERRAAYRSCAEIACYSFPSWSQETRTAYAVLLINALTVDREASVETILDVLTPIAADAVHEAAPVRNAMSRCATAALGRCPEPSAARDRLAALLGT